MGLIFHLGISLKYHRNLPSQSPRSSRHLSGTNSRSTQRHATEDSAPRTSPRVVFSFHRRTPLSDFSSPKTACMPYLSLSLSLHHWHHLHTLHCLTPHVAAAITQGLGEDVCGETQQHHLSRLCCQRWLGYLWCTGLGTRSGSSRLAHRDLTEKIQRDLRFALWCFRDRPQIQQFRDWTKNAVTIWEGMTLMLQLSIYHVSIIYCHVYDWKEEPLVVWLFFGLWFVMFSVIVFWGWSFDQVWLRWCWQCHLGPTGWCISTSFGLHRSGLQDDAVRFLGSQWTQVKHGSSQICFKCVSRDITILLMERSEAASQAGLTFEEALKVNSGCELKIVANSRKAQEIMAKV